MDPLLLLQMKKTKKSVLLCEIVISMVSINAFPFWTRLRYWSIFTTVNMFTRFHLRKHEVLVLHEGSNIEITRDVIQCLRHGAWLNDEVISLFFCALLTYDFVDILWHIRISEWF